MIENIDNVLEQLVLTGGVKVDWDQTSMRKGRVCPPGSWSIYTDNDYSNLEHLTVAARERLHRLAIHYDEDGQLHLAFDPETRRIEAMEVTELDTGGLLLTLLFWPGLDGAKALYLATMAHWKEAIDNGWFDEI